MDFTIDDIIEGIKIISSIMSLFEEKDEMFDKGTNYFSEAIKNFEKKDYNRSKEDLNLALHFYEKSENETKHQDAVINYSEAYCYLLLAYCNRFIGEHKNVTDNYKKSIRRFKHVEGIELTWFTSQTADIKKLQAESREMAYHLTRELSEWKNEYKKRSCKKKTNASPQNKLIFGVTWKGWLYILAFPLFVGILVFLLLWDSSTAEIDNEYINTNKSEKIIAEASTPNALILKLWNEYNIWDIDLYGIRTKGLKIHVNFEVHNCLGQKCKVLAFFYKEDYTGEIRGKTDRYKSTGGVACVSCSSEVLYEHSQWKDLSLFMPYNELECDETQIVSYLIVIRDENNQELNRSQGDFRYIKNNSE